MGSDEIKRHPALLSFGTNKPCRAAEDVYSQVNEVIFCHPSLKCPQLLFHWQSMSLPVVHVFIQPQFFHLFRLFLCSFLCLLSAVAILSYGKFSLSEPDSQHDDLWAICPSDCEPQFCLSGAGYSSAKTER